jgi:hypothetical protein
MKRLLLPLLLSISVLSCNNNNKQDTTSENEVDAARNFIRAALDGKWNDAQKFMVQDSTNIQLLDALESNWATHMSRDDKRGYREATINLYETRSINDSAVIVQYANSHKKQKDSLKVLRLNNQWLVDLKFSFPQTDTTQYAR